MADTPPLAGSGGRHQKEGLKMPNVQLSGDKLSADGNLAPMRSERVHFRAEKSSKSCRRRIGPSPARAGRGWRHSDS
jgi:hypothetical protein